MFGIPDYPTFVVAIVVFLFIPGPGNLVVLSGAGQGGVRGGLAATAGVILADQLLIWCALGGVAALLQGLPAAFAALRWVGAAYLVWLGLRMIWARADRGEPAPRFKRDRFLQQGFLVTLLNPKAVVFYLAFFPLFVDPATQRGGLTFAAMAATVAALTLLYCTGVVVLVRALAGHLRTHPRVSTGIQRIGGLFLVVFGVLLGVGL